MTGPPESILATSYSAIAPYYARLWAPVLLPFGRQLLDRLPLAGARRVLDLGTGSGTLLDDIAERAPQAGVFAVDLAEGMLRVAKQHHDAFYALCDARAVPVADAKIDVAISAFVLFNVPEPVRALREVHRVLGPGGALGMTTWGDEPDDACSEAWNAALAAHGAPADVTIPDGRQEMNTPDKLEALLRSAGFPEPRTWTDRVAHTWRPEDFIEFIAHGRRGRRLEVLPEKVRRACLADAAGRLSRLTSEELTERAEVVFATAAR